MSSNRLFVAPALILALVVTLGLTSEPRTPAAPPLQHGVEEILQADRDFARAARERGLDGWMDYMAPDAARMPAIGQTIVSGTESIRQLDAALFADPQVTLSWEPLQGHRFAGGDLGFTTGTYEVRHDNGAVLSHGHYVTFWRHEAGAWKVIFDTGAADG